MAPLLALLVCAEPLPPELLDKLAAHAEDFDGGGQRTHQHAWKAKKTRAGRSLSKMQIDASGGFLMVNRSSDQAVVSLPLVAARVAVMPPSPRAQRRTRW